MHHRLVLVLEPPLLHFELGERRVRRPARRAAARPRVVAAACQSRLASATARVRQLDQLAVHLVLDQPVHVVVGGVVPYALRLEVHRKVVRGALVVQHARAAAVPAAAYVAAHEADPEPVGGAAQLTRARGGRRLVRDVPADGARRVSPAAQAVAVEGVIAQDGHHARHLGIEPLETDGAHGKLDGGAQLGGGRGVGDRDGRVGRLRPQSSGRDRVDYAELATSERLAHLGIGRWER
eukprot:scaffold55482_cov17-Tisochrysis_lutea.AAC.2